MAKFLGFLSNICYATAVVLLAVAVYLWWTQEDAPGAMIDGPERTLTAVAPGSATTVVYHLQNPTRHPVRVCGMAEC